MASKNHTVTKCKATSRTTGKQCGQRPIPGGTVCRFHGGAAPQVKARALQRILDAADRLAGVALSIAFDKKAKPSDRLAVVRDFLDRAGLKPVEKKEHLVKSPKDMTVEELREWANDLGTDDSPANAQQDPTGD